MSVYALVAYALGQSFVFDTIDLYEKKNIPKVIYCIHALRYGCEHCFKPVRC
jgi:hypothetical protein